MCDAKRRYSLRRQRRPTPFGPCGRRGGPSPAPWSSPHRHWCLRGSQCLFLVSSRTQRRLYPWQPEWLLKVSKLKMALRSYCRVRRMGGLEPPDLHGPYSKSNVSRHLQTRAHTSRNSRDCHGFEKSLSVPSRRRRRRWNAPLKAPAALCRLDEHY